MVSRFFGFMTPIYLLASILVLPFISDEVSSSYAAIGARPVKFICNFVVDGVLYSCTCSKHIPSGVVSVVPGSCIILSPLADGALDFESSEAAPDLGASVLQSRDCVESWIEQDIHGYDKYCSYHYDCDTGEQLTKVVCRPYA